MENYQILEVGTLELNERVVDLELNLVRKSEPVCRRSLVLKLDNPKFKIILIIVIK